MAVHHISVESIDLAESMWMTQNNTNSFEGKSKTPQFVVFQRFDFDELHSMDYFLCIHWILQTTSSEWCDSNVLNRMAVDRCFGFNQSFARLEDYYLIQWKLDFSLFQLIAACHLLLFTGNAKRNAHCMKFNSLIKKYKVTAHDWHIAYLMFWCIVTELKMVFIQLSTKRLPFCH